MADSVQFYVDNTSPSISYYPFADTLGTPDPQGGWNPYFSLSGYATAPGETGNGSSFHITALNGASLSLTFNGTGIQLIGNATNASYSLTLDGSLTQPNSSSRADNILASFQGLQNSLHTLSLTTITSSLSSFVAFDRAFITAPPAKQNLSLVSTFPTQVIPDDDISFLGQWSFQNQTINDTSVSFHQSTTAGDRAHLSFTGTSLLLTGLISPGSGNYSVTIDNDTATTQTFNAASSFIQSDALLYFASGLDFQTAHSLDVQNVDGGLLGLKFEGVEVFVQTSVPTASTPCCFPSPTSPPPSHSSRAYPPGTIAAFILGAILVVVLSACFLFFYMNCYPRQMRRWRENREVKAKLAGDSMVLDIRSDRDRWRSGYDDGVVDPLGFSESLGVQDPIGEKLDLHDLSRPSPIAALADSKSELRPKNTRGWMAHGIGQGIGHVIGTSRNKSKSKSQNTSPSLSYTIDLQLTTPGRSFQTLPRSRSGSPLVDFLPLPSPSTPPYLHDILPKAAEITAAPAALIIPTEHLRHGYSSLTPFMSSKLQSSTAPSPSLSMPPRQILPDHVQNHDSSHGSILQFGIPNLGPVQSVNSSIEYLDVAAHQSESVGGGFTNEYDDDEVRGLRPRTSEVLDNRPVVAEPAPLLRDNVEQQEGPSDQPQDQEQTPAAADTPETRSAVIGDFLHSIDTTPFHVDFLDDSHRASVKSGSPNVRFQDFEEFGQKAGEPIPQIKVDSGSAIRSKVRSFLDFGATPPGSSGESTSSCSQRNPNISRWSSTTAPSTGTHPSVGSHDDHHHHTTNSTPSFPFSVLMPPSQDPQDPPSASSENQNRPQQSPQPRPQLLELPVGQHPHSDLDSPSPTDSVPMSVSDILFRHSVSDDESRRASTASRLLPPHPSLPGLSPVGEVDYSSCCSSPGTDSPPHALVNSPFIVQRVLGVTTPDLASPISQNHIRSGSMSNYLQ